MCVCLMNCLYRWPLPLIPCILKWLAPHHNIASLNTVNKHNPPSLGVNINTVGGGGGVLNVFFFYSKTKLTRMHALVDSFTKNMWVVEDSFKYFNSYAMICTLAEQVWSLTVYMFLRNFWWNFLSRR